MFLICILSSSSFSKCSAAKLINFINFCGNGCANCLCNFKTISYFDLYVSDGNRVNVCFTPVVTLFNIVLYQRTGIAQCPDFMTVSWIDS